MTEFTRREMLGTLGALVLFPARAQSFSGSDASSSLDAVLAQNFYDFWKNGFNIEPHSDGLVMSRALPKDDPLLTNPNYSIELNYYVKTDGEGNLADWTYVASVAPKSEPGKALHSMSRAGKIKDGRMSLGDVTTNYNSSNPLEAYNLMTGSFGNHDLLAVLAGLASPHLTRYVNELNTWYQEAKKDKDLKPMPQGYLALPAPKK